MTARTMEDPPSNTAVPPEIAPRLRRRLEERAKEIMGADPAWVARAEELRAQLRERERQIEAAERDLGAASLDGSEQQPATEKLNAARDDAKRVEAALDELERREEQARRKAWEAAVSEERRRGYRWMIEYLDRLADYLRAQAAASEAADRLRALDEVASIRNFQTGLWGFETETLYDAELLGATSARPLSKREERRRSGESPLSRLTIEECQRLREKAESLAGAEVGRCESAGGT